jgi:hypothetical protein
VGFRTVEEEVGRLEIAVHYIERVDVLDTSENLIHKVLQVVC